MRIIPIKSVYKEIKKNKRTLSRIINLAKTGNIGGFTPPSTLIGEFNYPRVSVGVIFTTDQNAAIYDAPKFWIKTGFDVSKIFLLRSTLINAKNNVDIRKPDNKYMHNVTLATLSENELAIDLRLLHIHDSPLVSKDLTPHGFTAELSGLKLVENIRLNKNLEKVYYDRDLKATDGMIYLYNNSIDDNRISKALSVGAIGIKRRIVPTKWAITAVDDVIGKGLLEEVKSYPKGDGCAIKTGTVLGNHYVFIFIPGMWSFELLETWNRDGKNIFSGAGDHEFYGGRSKYVKNTAGAYYAIRLAILEKLKSMKKQFSVIVIREITPEYFAPLGVWVVREGARRVLSGELNYFGSQELAIRNAKEALFYPINIEKKSIVLSNIEKQTNLNNF